MLDTTTKRRIDTARDILVGKVPDPKSQVEQITIALIYKFMDDMDLEAEEMGGQRTFFQGDFLKYAWNNIFDPRMGGFEILNLYSEAIMTMNTNPNIPQLFRDIFKNAYLPYRDPETLKSFLKIVNEFEYDHSERLGDAFEYLLSVLGSQGDAGQFRTPRHVIDFMVEIINPQKHETIMDPACGTAGFLISSYKHILKHNSANYKPEEDKRIFEVKDVFLSELTLNGKKYKGDLLTPDQRSLLSQNIRGFDISPDMVRLSLVNMYLHGLHDPHIYEYDTLTSEDKWNEFFDVILANPPFMSPKGGIRPHKRFSIASNRSEVLFVNYMMDHLTPTGKCAVIVPEGIIFQSGSAYKSLRKMLVDNFLIGVVSLPAGVFQPYSGVKTSILWLDKSLARKSDKILFVKIDNDGFDLGAQRRPIKLNDLPQAAKTVAAYKDSLLSGKTVDIEGFSNVSLVEKSRIGESGDFNLSGERYKLVDRASTDFPLVGLGNEAFFAIESGGTPDSGNREYWDGNIKWITLVDLPPKNLVTEIYDSQRKITPSGIQNCSAKIIPVDSVIVSTRATIGRIAINKVELTTNQGFKNIIIKDFASVSPYYLAYTLTQKVEMMKELASGGTFKEISKSNLSRIQIPLPPLSVQEEIVAEIEGYQKIIDGARQVVENYMPRIEINPEWEMVELGSMARIINGRAYKQEELLEKGKYPVLRVGNFFSNRSWYYSDLELEEDKYCIKGDLLYAWSASFGPRIWNEDKAIFHYHIWKIKPDTSKIDKNYLYYLLGIETANIKSEGGRGIAMIHITKEGMELRKFPVPELYVQEQIVSKIEKEVELVNASKQLIEIFEQKIKERIAKVWGEKE